METPQNPPSQSSDTAASPAGGVVMAEPPAASPTAEGGQAGVTEVPIETIVVPTGAVGGNAPKEPLNPFGPPPPAPGETAKPPGPKGSAGKWIKRIIFLAIFGVLLFFGGKFALDKIGSSREVTLTYWGLWENDAVMRSAISSFEAENPWIKVQYAKQLPRQYRERVQSAIDRDEGPDILRFHNTWVPMLAQYLAAVPADVMTASSFATSFYPVASADLVAGNRIFGIPVMIDGLGLYYNEDLFATAGVIPPTTWNDVLDMVPRLTVRSGDQIITAAIALGTTGNVEHFSDIVATMILQNGATLTELTSTQAQEAVIFYKKFSDPSDPVYTWNETMDNSVAAFANGRVAMMIAPSWRAQEVHEINPALRFKIAPIPQLPGNVVTWASYWVEGVSAKTKYPEQAWKFLQYITGNTAVTTLYTEASKTRLFGEPYARVELGSTLAGDPYASAYISQAKTAKSFPLASRTFDNGINDKMIKYLEDAINAIAVGTAPSAALSTAQSGFSQVLATYGYSAAQ